MISGYPVYLAMIYSYRRADYYLIITTQDKLYRLENNNNPLKLDPQPWKQ